jgi:hypothetical protein
MSGWGLTSILMSRRGEAHRDTGEVNVKIEIEVMKPQTKKGQGMPESGAGSPLALLERV